MLDAAGEPDQVLPDPEPLAPRGRELPVRGGRRVYRQSVDVPERRGPDAQLEGVQELEGRLPTSGLELEGDEPLCVCQHAAGDLVVGVISLGRVMDPRDLGMPG